MPARRIDLPQGTLETMILKTLSWGSMHGYGVANWIEHTSGGTLTVEEGSLYPALHRMEHRGWIDSEWRVTENNRRGKYYTLNSTGRRQLKEQSQSWLRLVLSVGRVMRAASAGSRP